MKYPYINTDYTYYWQCAFSGAFDNHQTIYGDEWEALSNYDRIDRSSLRKYYNDFALAMKDYNNHKRINTNECKEKKTL